MQAGTRLNHRRYERWQENKLLFFRNISSRREDRGDADAAMGRDEADGVASAAVLALALGGVRSDPCAAADALQCARLAARSHPGCQGP